jgi:uncharacterized protein (DUF2267 family)
MRHDRFLGKVQAAAHLADRGQAERATRATLETLGERIPDGLAEHLAAQLPHEIGEHLRRREVLAGAGMGERFGRDEFVSRVAARAGVNEPRAAMMCHAVAQVVNEASSGMVGGKVSRSLPRELSALLLEDTPGGDPR